MKKILIVDDEARIRTLVKDFLEAEGFLIEEAKNGKEAIDIISSDTSIDLMILDVMMPFYSGWEVMEAIRPFSNIPVLMLTAKSAEQDELAGFRLGVDDYIRKPFSPTILVARIKSLLQRVYGITEVVEKGNIALNYSTHRLSFHKEIPIRIIDLSSTEFKLLTALVENEKQILTRDQLLYKVWGFDYEGTDRTVDTHMNRLRIKLEPYDNYIQTIRGYGYKFEVI